MKRRKMSKTERDWKCWARLGIDPVDVALRHLKGMNGGDTARLSQSDEAAAPLHKRATGAQTAA